MSVYFVIQEEIHDPQALVEYREKARNAAHRGKLLAMDDDPLVLEGNWHDGRALIIEFEDEAAFRAWYESPAYQEALQIRLGATDSRSALLHGVP